MNSGTVYAGASRLLTEPIAKSRRFTATLILLGALALVAVIPASASAAFGISTFTVTPSTTFVGPAGHPDLATTISRTGSLGEDIRDLSVELPVGMTLNPSAATATCTGLQFELDACPSASYVGRFTVAATVRTFFPYNVTIPGSIYLLTPTSPFTSQGDAFTLGYVARPGLFIPKTRFRQNVSAGSLASSRKATINDLPHAPGSWFFSIFGSTGVTVQRIESQFNARTNTSQTGSFFVTNSTVCATATSRLNAVSYQSVSVSKTSSFEPSGCATTPETNIVSKPAAITNSAIAAFTFSSTPAGATFECRLDSPSGPFAACPASYSTPSLTNGAHTLEVRAVSATAGTDPTPASYAFTVDTIPPVMGVTQPAGLHNGAAITPAITATDATPVTKVCKVDAEVATLARCSAPVDELNGAHTFSVTGTDGAGNSATATSNFEVDDVAPAVSITQPAGLHDGAPIATSFSATD
ncbi:MAG: hypothetical protein JHC87_07435, partial [Thermoleophilaceae bacterium]|nr:hypothetical protein [Thermoleophilaceae bacterium]